MSRHTRSTGRWIVAGVAAGLPLALLAPQAGAQPSAAPAAPTVDTARHGTTSDLPKVPVMVGSGGAVSSVDRDASQVGIDVRDERRPAVGPRDHLDRAIRTVDRTLGAPCADVLVDRRRRGR